MITVNWDQLEEDEQGFVTLDDKPFTGTALDYYSNGCLRAQNVFIDGQRHGLQRWWFQDGRLAEEDPMCLQQHHGYHRVWHPNGNLQSEVHWENGIAVSRKYWDEHGNSVL